MVAEPFRNLPNVTCCHIQGHFWHPDGEIEKDPVSVYKTVWTNSSDREVCVCVCVWREDLVLVWGCHHGGIADGTKEGSICDGSGNHEWREEDDFGDIRLDVYTIFSLFLWVCRKL